MRGDKERARAPLADPGEAFPKRAAPPAQEGPRGRTTTGVPARWLDRLVEGVAHLPVSRGEEAVCRAAVDLLAGILPKAAVGLTLGEGAAATARPAPLVVTHFPALLDRRTRRAPVAHERRGASVSADGARLFPTFRREHVAVLTFDPTCTLRIGHDERAPEARHRVEQFAEHASVALGAPLAHARLHAELDRTRAELKQLRAETIQAEKLASLGQMAAGMVHELNNPLTSIVAYTDVLLRRSRRDGAPPEDEERLRRIGESAARMLRFTRDFVSYARPSSERPVPVAIHTVIEQALAFCEHVLSEVGAQAERHYGADIPLLRGMPEQLTQVFINLVTNACHALPGDGGRLVISTELAADERAVVVTVEDNGHGVPSEHAAQVFTPFFTTKGEGRGTGLGLSIVRNIVEGHGGTISLAAHAPEGARFVVRLPIGASR